MLEFTLTHQPLTKLQKTKLLSGLINFLQSEGQWDFLPDSPSSVHSGFRPLYFSLENRKSNMDCASSVRHCANLEIDSQDREKSQIGQN